MNGGVRITTRADASGRTRITELAASAPLGAKLTGAHTVHLIGTAAAPLDGDIVTIDLDIGAGTQLTVGTVAATMAWPARGDAEPSLMVIRARVGEGAVLRWLPEQLVPIAGCQHIQRCDVQLAPTASVVWREEVVLGRARDGEGPGDLDAELRISRGGAPLLHQRLRLDGSSRRTHGAPSLLAGARAVGSLIVAGPGVPEHCAQASSDQLRGAVLELEAGGRLASATATSTVELRRWLEARQAGLEPPQVRADGSPAGQRPPSTDPRELLSR